MVRYRIAVDVMGGDNGAKELTLGAVAALAEHEELGIVLFGNASEIGEALKDAEYDKDRLEIFASEDDITNYDSPMEAIFRKTSSSMVLALTQLAERDDIIGMISSGNTGALLAGALRYTPSKELKRPALAAVLPAEKGGFTCLVDTGANIDCTASQLHAFGRMGSDFMRTYYGLESPKVGILSNGAERTKGNKLTKAAFALLEADGELNFIGNIEANRAISGDCDVLVADGFDGNQVFKASEGIARRLITDIVKYAKKNNDPSIMKLVSYLMGIYDFSSLGGGIVLGCRKPIIKARGSANSASVKNTASMLLNMTQNKDLFFGKDVR